MCKGKKKKESWLNVSPCLHPSVAFVLCFSFVKQGLGLFVLSTRTHSVNLSFCCAIPKCRIQRTTPIEYQKAVWWCRSASMTFVFIDANYSDAFVQSSLWCSSIWWYTTRQENKQKNKTKWNTKRRMTYIKKSKRNCYTQKLMACSQWVSFVSCVKLQHGAAQNTQKNQTLRECSCYINVCSSGWVVQWLDLLLFSNIVR